MRIFRMALVGGFAGAFMAGNVGRLHCRPTWQLSSQWLPTVRSKYVGAVGAADGATEVSEAGERARWLAP
jgi:hypothetical protein